MLKPSSSHCIYRSSRISSFSRDYKFPIKNHFRAHERPRQSAHIFFRKMLLWLISLGLILLFNIGHSGVCTYACWWVSSVVVARAANSKSYVSLQGWYPWSLRPSYLNCIFPVGLTSALAMCLCVRVPLCVCFAVQEMTQSRWVINSGFISLFRQYVTRHI